MSIACLVSSLDVDVHLLLCDFGRSGVAYVETDPSEADATTVVRNLLRGEYERLYRFSRRMQTKAGRGMSQSVSQSRCKRLPSARVGTGPAGRRLSADE